MADSIVWVDWLQALGAVATAAGVFLAWFQLRGQKRQLRVDFEDRLAQQYRETIADVPLAALLGDAPPRCSNDDALAAFHRYFDLTNEQIFLQAQGRISKKTWKNWKDGIHQNFQLPAFAAAWSMIAGKLSGDIFEGLRELVPPAPVEAALASEIRELIHRWRAGGAV